jgi:hypothetical protein
MVAPTSISTTPPSGAIERGVAGVIDQQRDVMGDAGGSGNLVQICHVERQRYQTAIVVLHQVSQRCSIASSHVAMFMVYS